MRRSAFIFFASIFLPSLGLAWLAVHSVRDQQVVLEHQQAIICQNITDALTKSIQGQMAQVQSDFVKSTQQLLAESSSAQILARDFDQKLRSRWPTAEIGFAVNLDGEIYSPEPYDSPDARTFRDENDRFLSNRENVEVYSSNSMVANQSTSLEENITAPLAATSAARIPPAAMEKSKNQMSSTFDLQSHSANTDALSEPMKQAGQTFSHEAAAAGSAQNKPADEITSAPSAADSATTVSIAPAVKTSSALDRSTLTAPTAAPSAPSSVPTTAPPISTTPQATFDNEDRPISVPPTTALQAVPASSSSGTGMLTAGALSSRIQRQVIPQQMLARATASLSQTVPEESDFRRVIGSEASGALARFLENKLRVMVWSHPADLPIVFGAQLDQGRMVEALKMSFQIPELAADRSLPSSGGEICVAILDDSGHPVALSRPGFQGDWKHPFVATEIGESLPHWEAALYLVDPRQISRAARTLQATLGLIVLLLVAAIVSGGSLIAADVRRQVRLAQQKTDFVSNVSHELKTPLTSIRMFADLLAEKRVPDAERQATYLRIIAAEASRLTRLINNVLDFARLERGAPGDLSPGEHRDCDLVDAVRDVVETCGPHLEAAGVAFRHEIEAEALPIRGDRDALAQIILNLISNAEKYGGNDVLVRVRRQETSTGALGCVDVLDRGAGIPARQVKTVFEPFHRLDDSLSSGIPGSGLGLTLARRMARAHGGDVSYSARAGGGSCFTLTVPLAVALA